jgi:hypothetical protein
MYSRATQTSSNGEEVRLCRAGAGFSAKLYLHLLFGAHRFISVVDQLQPKRKEIARITAWHRQRCKQPRGSM